MVFALILNSHPYNFITNMNPSYSSIFISITQVLLIINTLFKLHLLRLNTCNEWMVSLYNCKTNDFLVGNILIGPLITKQTNHLVSLLTTAFTTTIAWKRSTLLLHTSTVQTCWTRNICRNKSFHLFSDLWFYFFFC